MTVKKITVPKGFLFSAAEAAIKKPGRRDMALIVSIKEAVASGMFTKNRIKAAPVRLDMKRIKSGRAQAIIVNSGNANACTGVQGMRDADDMTAGIAKGMNLKKELVYVCSTGVIGTSMPMDRVREGISGLASNIGKSSIHDVAAAIMTTDSFQKIASRKIKIGNKTTTITGVCKGAGMICPNMATMLCFILTDANISKTALNKALKSAVAGSFNRITIDGDMSTNDTVLIMANGLAGNIIITEKSFHYNRYLSALSEVTLELSKMIVMDGEGATKLIDIEIKNAVSDRDAGKGAFAIANSLLVKTAIYGNDANWGRIMAALGYSGMKVQEELIDVYLNGLKVVGRGTGKGNDKKANERLRKRDVKIIVDLHLGKGKARVLTCDLTEDYVKINAGYRT
ncbi:MAG: bifunctional glutamate N-acetyltransferase/amino-acid acetyltransferase ArgJ [Nitrospirota bacterium]